MGASTLRDDGRRGPAKHEVHEKETIISNEEGEAETKQGVDQRFTSFPVMSIM